MFKSYYNSKCIGESLRTRRRSSDVYGVYVGSCWVVVFDNLLAVCKDCYWIGCMVLYTLTCLPPLLLTLFDVIFVELRRL